MTQPTPKSSADLALTVFLAPLATGRRVLWLGDASTGAPDRLATYAASVRVLDTSGRGRRRGGAAKVSIIRPGPLGLEAGSFDLAVIPDVSVLEDTAGRLAQLAEVVGDGLVVAGTPSGREQATSLRTFLSDAFREVRMLGQASFQGVVLADLSSEVVDEVVVDGSLVDEQEVDRLYGIAADELPKFDPYMLVQVAQVGSVEPTDQNALEGALASRSREVEALREALGRAESRLEQAQRRLVTTEGELASARAAVTTTGSSSSSSSDGDFDRLEAMLRDRGDRVRELGAELDRRALVMRDAVEELREYQQGRRSGSGEQLLDAEAARTEATLELDELRAEVLERRDVAKAVGRRVAELEGRSRGFAARLAETVELREVAETRLNVLNLDLGSRDEDLRRHRAQLAEVREQLELAMIRVHTPEASRSPKSGEEDAQLCARLEASERRLSSRVGQLSGQLMGARDLIEQASMERDRARAETLRLMAQVSTLETRMEGLRIGYEMRIAMLGADIGAQPVQHVITGTDEAIERELRRVSDELEALKGECDGLRLRLADRELALAAAQATQDAPDALDQADKLRDDVAVLRVESGALTLRLAEAEEQHDKAAARARDLAQAIASRDALITRLQMDLADEEHSHRIYEEQSTRSRSEIKRLREAIVEAATAVDDKERAEAETLELRRQIIEMEERAGSEQAQSGRTEELEAELREVRQAHRGAESEAKQARETQQQDAQQRRAALEAQIVEAQGQTEAKAAAHAVTLEALRETRRLLDEWRADAPSAGRSEITAVGTDAPEESRFDSLEQEVSDKDTLLRSLTAQLEQRDDRIRAFERRIAEGSHSDLDAEALHQSLLEFEERSSRLQEELDHERSARAGAERELAEVAPRPDMDAELGRLRKVVLEREGSLEEALLRAGMFERDIASLRSVVLETRHGLEALLGEATSAGDPATAERIGALLSLVGRF